jgi:hypothetical protein
MLSISRILPKVALAASSVTSYQARSFSLHTPCRFRTDLRPTPLVFLGGEIRLCIRSFSKKRTLDDSKVRDAQAKRLAEELEKEFELSLDYHQKMTSMAEKQKDMEVLATL